MIIIIDECINSIWEYKVVGSKSAPTRSSPHLQPPLIVHGSIQKNPSHLKMHARIVSVYQALSGPGYEASLLICCCQESNYFATFF